MAFTTVANARERVPAIMGLSDSQVEVFISTFNDLEAQDMPEGASIAQAIAAANAVEKARTRTKGTRQIIKAVDEELMQSIEIVYEPYELDAQNQWMSPETIVKACKNFNDNLESGNLRPNMYHSKDEDGIYSSTDSFTILKSWVSEVDCSIGGQDVKESTWICKLQWNNPEVWELRKNGTYLGVSIGANGVINKPQSGDT